MAGITLKGERKNLGMTEVTKGIGVEIALGEFAVLAGPSGRSKSTLLNLITGLETLSVGDILIGGRTVNDVRPSRRLPAIACRAMDVPSAPPFLTRRLETVRCAFRYLRRHARTNGACLLTSIMTVFGSAASDARPP